VGDLVKEGIEKIECMTASVNLEQFINITKDEWIFFSWSRNNMATLLDQLEQKDKIISGIDNRLGEGWTKSLYKELNRLHEADDQRIKERDCE